MPIQCSCRAVPVPFQLNSIKSIFKIWKNPTRKRNIKDGATKINWTRAKCKTTDAWKKSLKLKIITGKKIDGERPVTYANAGMQMRVTYANEKGVQRRQRCRGRDSFTTAFSCSRWPSLRSSSKNQSKEPQRIGAKHPNRFRPFGSRRPQQVTLASGGPRQSLDNGRGILNDGKRPEKNPKVIFGAEPIISAWLSHVTIIKPLDNLWRTPQNPPAIKMKKGKENLCSRTGAVSEQFQCSFFGNS